MRQTWGKLAFFHWTVPAAEVDRLLPEGIELDLFGDQAWVSVVPFSVSGLQASVLPPLPGLLTFNELSVRTYVRALGFPGVWHFSLDASSAVAVQAARMAFHLPYYNAEIELGVQETQAHCRCRRRHRNAPAATFEARWTVGENLRTSRPGSLEHFLTERHSLFTSHKGRLERFRVRHDTCALRRGTLLELESTMIEAAGMPPAGEPQLVHCVDELAVEVWPLESAEAQRVREKSAGTSPAWQIE